MQILFIGVDISKEFIDFSAVDSSKELIDFSGRSANTPEGIVDFITSVKELKDSKVWVCLEHTGHYGALLIQELSDASLTFSLINPLEIKKSLGLTRGKTDAIDAKRIALYGAIHSHKLEPYTLPTEALRKLKEMMSIRDRYAKILVQLKNGLKASRLFHKTVDIQQEVDQQLELIKTLEDNINQTEKAMLALIKRNKSLKTTYDKITKVIGVGPITAIKCITETHNFIRFTNPRKFCCHTGLAPFEYSSGSSVRGRTKTNPYRDKALKAILFKAASTAIQHDPQLKAYYTRKLNEGKHKLTVLNAVASKLVLRIFAVAKREEPFVKLAA